MSEEAKIIKFPLPPQALDGMTEEEAEKFRLLWEVNQQGISAEAFRQLFVMLHSGDHSNRTLSLLLGKGERTVTRLKGEIRRLPSKYASYFPDLDRAPLKAREVRNHYKRDSISWDLRKAVYDRDGYACVQCGRTTHLTVDHCIAVTSGGPTILENLRTLCLPCNVRKGAKNVRPVS